MTHKTVVYKYGTGNPVEPNGSGDVRDGIDNLQSFDVFMNATEDTYNQRDGAVVGTISGANNRFDAQIINMGFTRVGTFSAGATLTDPRQTLLWETSAGGDGQEYGWSGTFPKVVPPASTPLSTGGIAVGAWISRFDPELRIQFRETLRRSYAAAGHPLVAGSFEAGGTLASAADVMMHEATGKAFSGAGPFPQIVPPGTDPTSGGFADRSAWPVASMQEFNAGDYGLHPANTGLQNCKALQALSAAVSAANGGKVVFPPGTYTIGAQTFAGAAGKGYSYKDEPCFRVDDLTGPIFIEFHGTRLVWADGLRFGAFDPVTGDPIVTTLPHIDYNTRADVGVAIKLEDSTSLIEISGVVEIHGNDSAQIIGGQWGDRGWQCYHTGIQLVRNKQVRITGSLYTHHHLLDGLYVGSLQYVDGSTSIDGVVSVYNGRQGISMGGGNNITVSNSLFGYTAEGALANSPAFNVDLETEVSKMQDVTFNSCQFPLGTINIHGGCVVSDNMSVRGLSFNDCLFESGSGNVLYMRNKGVTFSKCRFHGNISPLQSGSNTYQIGGIPRFIDCTFSNLMRDGTKACDWPKIFDVVIADINNCTAKAYCEDTDNTPVFWMDGSNIDGFDVTVTGTMAEGGNFMLVRGSNATIKRLKIYNNTTSTVEYSSAQSIAYTTATFSENYLSKDASGNSSIRWGSNSLTPYSTGWLIDGDYKFTSSTSTNFSGSYRRDLFQALQLNMSALSTDNTVLLSASSAGTSGRYYPKGAILFNPLVAAGGSLGWVCITSGVAGSTAVFKTLPNIGA